MRFVAAAIVLALPILDLLATARFARWTGVPVWAWVAGGLVAGVALLRSEGLAFRARMVAAMHGDVPVLRGLLDSGRKVLAAFQMCQDAGGIGGPVAIGAVADIWGWQWAFALSGLISAVAIIPWLQARETLQIHAG